MGGKKDKKKKSKDPLKKAALAAKKEAKADKAALKRIQKEQDRLNSLSIRDDDRADDGHHAAGGGGGGGGGGKKSKGSKKGDTTTAADDLDDILASYRNRSAELNAVELQVLGRNGDASPFPNPPRGNFTWTLCPGNGMFYMVSSCVWCMNVISRSGVCACFFV